jgi:hypothetical protein
MTAKNQLGEILELPAQPGSGAKPRLPRSPERSTPEQIASLTLGPSATVAGTSADDSRDGATTPGTPSVDSWRASSYDLLHGLIVRDVSEKIPQRIFQGLFSPEPAAAPASVRKWR